MQTFVTKNKRIGEHEYEVTALPAWTGLKVLSRLKKGTTLSDLPEEDFEYLCRTFSKYTVVKMAAGTPTLESLFEIHFSANYHELMEWLGFCLEVNYEGFFVAAGVPPTASPGAASQ